MKSKKQIEQEASNFAGDRSLGVGHGFPSFEANLLERGYLAGYKQSQKDKMDNLLIWLSKEDLITDSWEIISEEYSKSLKK